MSAETLSYQFRNSQSQEEALVTYQWQALYFESIFLHEMAEACRQAAMMVSAAPKQDVKSALEHGMQRYAGAMQKLSEGDK